MKIATVGAWHVHTQEYAEAIQKNPKAQLCCLWDDNQERGQAMAEKLGVPFQPDLDAIWADPTIEGVQVTTATNQHRDILLAAAKAGKHIFTEKVLALTNEDAEEIAQAVRESGVKFTISYPHKTWPTLSWARSPTPGCTTTTMAACGPRPTAPWAGCRPTSMTQPKPAAAP